MIIRTSFYHTVLKSKSEDVIFILVSIFLSRGLRRNEDRPTQNAIRQLNSYGVQPDIIIARGGGLDRKRKENRAFLRAGRNVIQLPISKVLNADYFEKMTSVGYPPALRV